MRKLYILERILSKFTYVHKLRMATGHGYALADMIGVHGPNCCQHKCINIMAAKFMEEHRQFENLAYRKNEWWDNNKDNYGNNFLG